MMSDLISRQAAIDAHCELCEANDKCICVYCKDIERFMNLPTAEPKKGKWIEEDDDIIHGHCSSCGWASVWQQTDVFGMNYCPNCGAKMEESDG